ncbi:hypothetical protein SAMN04515691_2468 [Leifsonia sp. 98AMF]|uniref:hypothetical protein n=1 Tax=unclassified Leifsonia TaxID=2663824 RepID=UPI00087B793C|nr:MULTISPECIES: hypothetical protein [unclassified Leifsonia]SDH26711.1 hypothetical protein SAMN04515690_1549 [Leifsonia sp. 197AMF]SDJ11891.1 hypothetical protein SAMN04515684_2235 [Leifsonia sp. 466MF]SDJ57723.1 hypothetical protein SAMN04515683_0510 [Leifsonia sp. 157MF]SDN33341.1 hypothetical protein SAMN04515686_0418 [Leifsonia sp. 509MF]SEM88246.1 hypothetical protein SAMN04515685_0498 [Leifsonia sp. 467MF]
MGETPRSAGASTLSGDALLPAVPGAAILIRVRRLISAIALVAVGYGFLSNGSRAFCPGAGPAAESCVSLQLHPSPFVFAALAFVVFVAIGRVLRRARTEADALRTLDRAALVGTAIAGVSLLIGVVWFGLIPLESWNGSATYFFPFPFASVDLTVTPAS